MSEKVKSCLKITCALIFWPTIAKAIKEVFKNIHHEKSHLNMAILENNLEFSEDNQS